MQLSQCKIQFPGISGYQRHQSRTVISRTSTNTVMTEKRQSGLTDIVTPSDVAAVSLQKVSSFSAGQNRDGNDSRDRPELLKSHLTIKHALLFETQILGGVGHYGEGGFGVMPEKKKNRREEIT